MKILVTGTNGQLGHDLINELSARDYDEVTAIDKEDLDITDTLAVKTFLDDVKPDVIIHCAAYTAVDSAEDNFDSAYKVNVDGTKNLLDCASKYQSKFVYISTDYVFSGDKEKPYCVSDTPNPTSVYGKTKYLGELQTLKYDKHFIIRISWLFGKNGNNFVKTMLKLAKHKSELSVVSDQIGSPTYSYDLSRLIVDMIETNKFGVYHATNEEICTWYEFAETIFEFAEIDIEVHPIKTNQYPTKAKRPMNSVLSKQSLIDSGFKILPTWKDALKRFLKEIEVI